MGDVIAKVRRELEMLHFKFEQPPIIIGGTAMEYYAMRKSGSDIDLVVCDTDYQALARQNPAKRKDIYGDLGVVLEPFEIWRSIALLDYDFFNCGAADFDGLRLISFERLLFTRVAAMEVQKYHDDLIRCKEYVYAHCRNPAFLKEAESHSSAYKKQGGIVWNGKY